MVGIGGYRLYIDKSSFGLNYKGITLGLGGVESNKGRGFIGKPI